jgi:putative oxygen-independent coproporphyrinogen III oxidase
MRLYVHWPFCISLCAYCDFNSRVADRTVLKSYRETLLEEIRTWSLIIPEDERFLESLYLGGGTPSTMSGDEVNDLLDDVSLYFALSRDAEVTIEVNPASWTYRDFCIANAGGFNRFSIGIQSLNDNVLSLLGRAHNSGDARKAVQHALRLGDAAVSVDVLYALPAMGIESMRTTIDEVLGWHPHHISAYALTMEEATRLPGLISSAGISLPGDDETADQYLEICGKLKACGYEQYEISNFCLPGYHSRHNLAYWKREQYLGIGVGAHSLLYGCRFFNMSTVLGYMKRIRAGLLAVERCERMDKIDEFEELIMLGMRTSEGIPEEILIMNQGSITNLESLGLLHRWRGRICLTTRGMFLSNAVIGELLYA